VISNFFFYDILLITDVAVVTHIHLELNVDFDKKILEGKAILDVKRISSITELVSEGYFSFLKTKFLLIYLRISNN